MGCNAREKITLHIRDVRLVLGEIISELWKRHDWHDKSKLSETEFPLYDKYICLMAQQTYGSQEYYDTLLKISPALSHHYRVNPHHPEHHMNGISGMTLVDLVEMVCDWLVASANNNKNGSFRQSLEVNSKRFEIGPQLTGIIANTERWLSEMDSIKAIRLGSRGNGDEKEKEKLSQSS